MKYATYVNKRSPLLAVKCGGNEDQFEKVPVVEVDIVRSCASELAGVLAQADKLTEGECTTLTNGLAWVSVPGSCERSPEASPGTLSQVGGVRHDCRELHDGLLYMMC